MAMDDQESGRVEIQWNENKKKLPKRREILIGYYCDSKEKENDERY